MKNNNVKKLLHTVLILAVLFLVIVSCAVFNQILQYKIEKQELQTMQTISDILSDAKDGDVPSAAPSD